MTQSHISKRLPYLGLLLAFSIILSYVESLIPMDFLVPGIKLGLPNFSIVLCLCCFKRRDAFILALFKSVIISLLFGNMMSFFYGFVGAMFSILVMIGMFTFKKFSIPVISALGGVCFNIGQMLVAFVVLKSDGLLYYLPILLLAGMFTGIIIGLLVVLVLPKINIRGIIS